MTKDERRQELERIRDSPGGPALIAAIFKACINPKDRTFVPASFVQAMIEQILGHEFPDEPQ